MVRKSPPLDDDPHDDAARAPRDAEAGASRDAPRDPDAAMPFDGPFASAVRASAQQIWQAGLGAFAKAQGEGGKVFESLVKDGIALQRRTQEVAEERFGEVGSRMQRLTDEVQSRAGQHWDRLESIFEKRVAQALRRLGVPSSRELEAIAARLEALEARLEPLAGGARPANHQAARSPATSRPAAAKKGAVPKSGVTAKRAAARTAPSSAGGSPAAPRRKPPASKRGA